MEQTTLKAEPRQPHGSKAAQRLRQQGQIPAVIYGHGEATVHVAINGHELEVALGHGAHLLSVELDGQQERYLIKDVQYDSLQMHPIHADLARVNLDERVQVSVSLELRGTPAGIAEGGQLEQHVMELEVDCRVTDIPETLRVSVAELKLNEHLYVRDVPLPEGVTAVADATEVVCTVRPLVAAEAEEEAEAAEGAGGAEPEVISRGRDEEGDQAE